LHYTVLYSQSPKCQRELVACASELDVHLNRIDRVLSVRWVASSCRTVMAVWRSYAALHEHFVRKSTDPTLDGRERCKFEGLAKKLKSPVFVKNMGLMLDALEELSDLSLALQRVDVTLSSATKLISRQVAVFSARTACESEHYSEACQAVASGEFKGVTLLCVARVCPRNYLSCRDIKIILISQWFSKLAIGWKRTCDDIRFYGVNLHFVLTAIYTSVCVLCDNSANTFKLSFLMLCVIFVYVVMLPWQN